MKPQHDLGVLLKQAKSAAEREAIRRALAAVKAKGA